MQQTLRFKAESNNNASRHGGLEAHLQALQNACVIGSSDFGTAENTLRSNYKRRFSLFVAIFGENGLFGSNKLGVHYIRSQIF
jgi:hypothetical protein